MQYNETKLLDGEYHDINAWACGFHYSDYSNSKATRNIPPTRVYITYDHPQPGHLSRFKEFLIKILPYAKNGSLKVKPIPFKDNTACGQKGLLIFDNEKDCIDAYIKLVDEAKEGVKSSLGSYIIQKHEQMDSLDDLKRTWIGIKYEN